MKSENLERAKEIDCLLRHLDSEKKVLSHEGVCAEFIVFAEDETGETTQYLHTELELYETQLVCRALLEARSHEYNALLKELETL